MVNSVKMPKVIIGLGNPGFAYSKTRHNIGFIILDSLAQIYGGSWRTIDKAEVSEISINNNNILLIKPQTFMNKSGDVVSYLSKKGIKSEDALVVHDELELPFGKVAYKFGGSAKGHNGLKSLISAWSADFGRIRFGIGRPERKEDVPDYVLAKFLENQSEIDLKVDESVNLIESIIEPH